MTPFGIGKPDIEKMKAKRDIEDLIKLLINKKDRQFDRSVVYALEKIGGERAVEGLLLVLRGERDYDDSLRENAARALGRIGDSRVVDGLVATLKDYAGSVSKSAAIAL